MKTIKKIVTGLLVAVLILAGAGEVKANSGAGAVYGMCAPQDGRTHRLDLHFHQQVEDFNDTIEIKIKPAEGVELMPEHKITMRTASPDKNRNGLPLPQEAVKAIGHEIDANHVIITVPGYLLRQDGITMEVSAIATPRETDSLGVYGIIIGDDREEHRDIPITMMGLCQPEKPVEPEETPGETEEPGENPTEQPGGESPNTGDPMAPYLWSTLLLVGATTLIGTSKANKRRK